MQKKEDESISLLSPFLVHSLTGEPKSINNRRAGDLLIQCAKEKHETTLLELKNFCGLKCTVTPHSSLNICKGIVHCPALNKQSCQHILEFMKDQGVTDVRRIRFFRDCVKKPTNTFVLNNTCHTSVLPSVVEIGFISAKVDVCIPHPPRWYQCQVFGHNENKCGRHDKLYVLTAVCLSITQLASVKVLKCVN